MSQDSIQNAHARSQTGQILGYVHYVRAYTNAFLEMRKNAARIWNTSYIAISLRKIIMLYMYRFSRTNVNILIIHVVQKSPALIKMTLM